MGVFWVGALVSVVTQTPGEEDLGVKTCKNSFEDKGTGSNVLL